MGRLQHFVFLGKHFGENCYSDCLDWRYMEFWSKKEPSICKTDQRFYYLYYRMLSYVAPHQAIPF